MKNDKKKTKQKKLLELKHNHKIWLAKLKLAKLHLKKWATQVYAAEDNLHDIEYRYWLLEHKQIK